MSDIDEKEQSGSPETQAADTESKKINGDSGLDENDGEVVKLGKLQSFTSTKEKKEMFRVNVTSSGKIRATITVILLSALLAMTLGFAIIFILMPSDPTDKIMEFVKFGIGVISPLFGTAMGFYFRDQMEGKKDNNPDNG